MTTSADSKQQDAGALAHPAYRADIDGLRAVAVLLVVAFHAFPHAVPGGFIGVDVFFVISGFLISGIIFGNLQRGTFGFVDFYIRRTRRIFPSLLLVLAACYAFGFFFLFADEFQQLGWHIAGGSAFMSNFTLLHESGYFDGDADSKPLLHLWSLGIEEQFYIVWPLLAWGVWRLRINAWWLIVLSVAVSFGLNLWKMAVAPPAAFYLPQTRFWELLVGAGLAQWMQRPWRLPGGIGLGPDARSGVGALLIASCVGLIDKHSAFPGWWALMPSVGAMLIISAGPGAWVNRVLLSNRLLGWFGLISFPLYLWHWPLLSFARIINSEAPSAALSAALMVLAVLLAWLSYRWVEQPLRFGSGRVTKALALFVLMACMGVTGLVTSGQAGLPKRAVNIHNKVTSYDWEAGYRLGICFLDGVGEEAGRRSLSAQCGVDKAPAGHRGTVLLWGDSHAASMYRGILQEGLNPGQFLGQYTSSGCPPVLGFATTARPECNGISHFAMEAIKKAPPDVVILAARWAMYDGRTPGWGQMTDQQVLGTLADIKAAGVKRIILFGPLPAFQSALVRIGRREFVADSLDRTLKGLDTTVFDFDRRMRRLAGQARVEFVSPLELLCNEQGCLMSASPHTLMPMAWDYGHLTEDGARYLIRAAIDRGGLAVP